jgi:hypothetical protein
MSFTNVDVGFNAGRYSFDGPDFASVDVDERQLLEYELAVFEAKSDTMGGQDDDGPDSVGGADAGDVPDTMGDDEDESEDDDTESERA